jgi:hypothetical protein
VTLPRGPAPSGELPGHGAPEGSVDGFDAGSPIAPARSQSSYDDQFERSWIHGGNICDLCAFVLASKYRTSNVIRIILAIPIGFIAAVAILFCLGVTSGVSAQFGFTAAGIGTLITVVSLVRAWVRRHVRDEQYARGDRRRRAAR